MSSKEKGVSLRALAFQKYRGREVRKGERFEVDSEEDAADLVALHFAARERREESAEEGSNPTPGTYNRRDMRARK